MYKSVKIFVVLWKIKNMEQDINMDKSELQNRLDYLKKEYDKTAGDYHITKNHGIKRSMAAYMTNLRKEIDDLTLKINSMQE